MLLDIIKNYFYTFLFMYPVLMSAVWITGGLYFWFIYERKGISNKILQSKTKPPITILIPCYNEAQTIEVMCKHLQHINYPNYKVIFINDASVDSTGEIIDTFVAKIPNFKHIKLEQNCGKAHALNMGLAFVDTPLVLVLDADTILDRDALNWFVTPFVRNSNIGAVTGNVILMDKSSYLSKFQAAEFTCIIGLIKRCQHIFGKLFTVSGCATIYNVEVLLELGGFSTKTATEDVDITWRVQENFYKVIFEPRAKVFIQAPLNIIEYVKQRKRWATGGWHLLRQHTGIFKEGKLKSLWLVYLEFATSYIWAFCLILLTIWNLATLQIQNLSILELSLGWTGAVASFIFIVQAIVAISINIKNDIDLEKCFLWICWYPIVFFGIGVALVLWTAPKGLFQSTNSSGKWDSPTRDNSEIFHINHR